MNVVREAKLYKKIKDKVQCNLCERRCLISEGEKGFCKTRVNIKGKLYTLVYGDISAIESRPIEIKPFFHFYPGSSALTFSTWSCNFACPWCQNWRLSGTEPNPERAKFVSPKEIVKKALLYGDSGLCVSFQEPTLLFEFCLQVFKLAKEKNLYNTFVSNGYMSLEALKMLRDAGLDAMNIDIKGNEEVYERYLKAKASVVWRNAREAKKLGIHVEMVNLIITDINDGEACISEIVELHLKNVGEETPLHFTRYFPAYKFSNPATKIQTLEKAYEIAKKEGVLYPYLGNVPGHKYENTYCHNCGELLIKRLGYKVLKINIKNGRCPKCGEKIPIVL
ncbi:MAG: AmmeMemoRadiSam system radical SAM enzyme [Candidatus Hydrothermarchaeota archaeon]|nr:MAG: AmmeMemoRadiSam system radical SAM enzyme [Candidatus Hydrothermarchaeota archaeon]